MSISPPFIELDPHHPHAHNPHWSLSFGASMETVDAVVIGAGVVGLAVARALALSGRETLILEAANTYGTGTSARNSEVVHAGIYYPKGSLKARLCISGKMHLYAYCAERSISHKRLGKLIVAGANQLDDLAAIHAKAEANGVDDLEWLEREEVLALEPRLNCAAALFSPSTGIIDSHGLMLSLLGDLENAGGLLSLNSPVKGGEIDSQGIILRVGGAESMTLRCKILVNCAGLAARSVALSIDGIPQDRIPPAFIAKGNYFSLSGKAPFTHLVYPVPEPGGLGVHLTLDLGGQARFGPDVEWIDAPDYEVDPTRGEKFYAAIRRYWPDLPDQALHPDYAGLRPKISGPGDPAADFAILGPKTLGREGLVSLHGIESPGLTSCLAIAKEVLSRLNIRETPIA